MGICKLVYMIDFENNSRDLEKLHFVQFEMLKTFDAICKNHDINYVLFAGTALGAIRHQNFIPWDDDLDVALLRDDYEKFLKIAKNELAPEYYLQKEFSAHWPMFYTKLRKNNTAYIEKMAPIDHKQHQGIYIDIFPCDNLASNFLMQHIQFFCSKIIIAKSLSQRGYVTNHALKKAFIQFCKLIPLKLPYRITIRRNDSDSMLVHTFLGASSRFEKAIFKREWFTQTIGVPFGDGVFPVSKCYEKLLTTMYGNYMQLPPLKDRIAKAHAVLVDFDNSYEHYIEWQSDQRYSVYPRSIR